MWRQHLRRSPPRPARSRPGPWRPKGARRSSSCGVPTSLHRNVGRDEEAAARPTRCRAQGSPQPRRPRSTGARAGRGPRPWPTVGRQRRCASVTQNVRGWGKGGRPTTNDDALHPPSSPDTRDPAPSPPRQTRVGPTPRHDQSVRGRKGADWLNLDQLSVGRKRASATTWWCDGYDAGPTTVTRVPIGDNGHTLAASEILISTQPLL